MSTPQKLLYNGQICWISSTYRALHGPREYERKFGTRYIVRFEDGHCENIPAGKFNSKVQYLPEPELSLSF